MRNQLPSLVSLVLIAGCEEHGSDPYDPGPTQVSISVTARNQIAGVQKLTLMVSPSNLMDDCENSDPRFKDGCVSGQSNIRIFTDRDGVNSPMKSPGAPCPGTNAAPTDMRCWAAENDLTLLDTLGPDTLPTAYIARDNELSAYSVYKYRAFSSVLLNPWAIAGERDSYVWLSDGRECEIEPLFPRPAEDNVFWGPLPDWISIGVFPLTDFSIRPGERWHIELVVELGPIDPALCDANRPLHITPISATAVLLENCPQRRNGSCVAL